MKRQALIALAFAFASTAFGQANNAAAWYKADSGVTTDGTGNVITWGDSSGNAHDASGGTAPVLVSNGINGLPAVQFNGGQELDINGQVLDSNEMTIFAVVTDTLSDGGFHELFSNWDPTTFENSVFLGTAGDTPTTVRFTDEVGGATDPNHTQTGVGAISNPTQPFILGAINSATGVNITDDGSSIYSQTMPIDTRDFSDIWRIGSQGGSFEFWNGDIGELIVYDRALTPTEYAATELYLANKFNILPEPSGFCAFGVGAGLLCLGRRIRRR